MSLDKIHLEILQLLMDNTPEDFSEVGGVSHKILLKSVNYKPRQIEKACKELDLKGFVELHAGFYKSDWKSISITDEGMDYLEFHNKSDWK